MRANRGKDRDREREREGGTNSILLISNFLAFYFDYLLMLCLEENI